MSTLRELELEQTSPRLLELLRKQGLVKLSGFQTAALEKGVLRGASQLLVTYDYDEAYQIAEITALNRLLTDYKARALVLCPNAHQAEKRYSSLIQKCRRLGIEGAEAIRRRTAISQEWKSGRVVVGTYGSLDIAMRVHPESLEGLQCVIVERLDLIGQPDIGATLETTLVNLMGHSQAIQYIATCPPVADLKDLSLWLRADIVEDTKPEVKRIFSVKAFSSVRESLADLTEFVHYRRGQIMILCPDIASCEELAAHLTGTSRVDKSSPLDLRLTPSHQDDLRILSNHVRDKYSKCEVTSSLAGAILRGVAFLHEGVSRAQRREVSSAWEEGLLPVVVMPTRFAIASGIKATVVFLVGVFTKDVSKDVLGAEDLTMLSEWQLNDVLQSAGRAGVDNEAFAIVVVDKESERTRVLDKFFTKDGDGNISPRLGEVDSCMDDPENIQDLVISQLCGRTAVTDDPFAVISRTFWAATNRAKGITQESMVSLDGSAVSDTISLRTTKSTVKRADEISDSRVKLVSVTPFKIEGLIHSGTRELWHYVTLRPAEGVSCSCESWKYQGIRNHRLCKHLVKFCSFALKSDETRPYAASVIGQALRGLRVFDDMERDDLIIRDGKAVRCTDLGASVAVLGVPVRDAKKVMKAVARGSGRLRDLLVGVTVARTDLPEDLVRRVIDSVPADSIEQAIKCEKDMPGMVENILEELHYVNSILLRLIAEDARDELHKEIYRLQGDLTAMLTESS